MDDFGIFSVHYNDQIKGLEIKSFDVKYFEYEAVNKERVEKYFQKNFMGSSSKNSVQEE